MTKHFGYRPLMGLFTIADSPIEGKGLFAITRLREDPYEFKVVNVDDIVDAVPVITHYRVGKDLIRTPIGGFINHSEDPNCKIVGVVDDYTDYDTIYYLVPLRTISAGEEITLNYDVHCMCGKP